jgi:hypothetical protein
MEATMFTGWIYDHLQPHAATRKVAHPLMLRAIAAARKKNDRIDAGTISDRLPCDFLPVCHPSWKSRNRRPAVSKSNLSDYGTDQAHSPFGLIITIHRAARLPKTTEIRSAQPEQIHPIADRPPCRLCSLLRPHCFAELAAVACGSPK